MTMAKERFKVILTVYLILMKDGKVLLSRRYNTGFQDGKYSLPAGHLDGNETLTHAMMREAKEEIGIDLNPENLKLVHVIHRKEPAEERINVFFTAETWIGESKIMEPHKCDNLNWFDINNLPDNVIPYVKQALECFKNGDSYSETGW